MDLVVRARGAIVGDRFRSAIRSKLEKLGRVEPRAVSLEIDVAAERNSQPEGAIRLDGILALPRRTFRAHATSHDRDVALEELFERLERQVRDHHQRRKARLHASDARRPPRDRRREAGTR